MDYIEITKTIDKYIKINLTKKRYRHSLEVASMAKTIAIKFNINDKKAYLAGLAHDIAREIDILEIEKLIIGGFFSKSFYTKPILFHGPVGSEILKNDFNIREQDILEAVKYHTIGYPNLGDLAKVIYVSDYISLDRVHIDNNFRIELLTQPLDKMVVMVVDKTREYLLSINEAMLIETENMYNNLIREISEK